MTAKKERKKEKRKGTPGDQTSPLRDDGLCDKSAAKHDFIQRNALLCNRFLGGVLGALMPGRITVAPHSSTPPCIEEIN